MHRTTSRRVARAPLAALALCVTGVSAGAFLAPPAGASGPKRTSQVRQLVTAARKAILSHSAVRISSEGRDLSTHKLTSRSFMDAGRNWSRQTLTAGGITAHILVTPSHAYFSGNRAGLTAVFNMPADDLGRVGTKWVAVSKSEPQYKGFSSTVLRAVPGLILPKRSAIASVHLASATLHGKQVHVLTWTVDAGGTSVRISLELAASGPVLPVSETETAGKNEQRSVFGHWDEHPRIKAPRDTVPYKSLSAT